MTLSRPASIFGFELEPNSFETFASTADFYLGDSLVDSIGLWVSIASPGCTATLTLADSIKKRDRKIRSFFYVIKDSTEDRKNFPKIN